jgi:hypothetical protein
LICDGYAMIVVQRVDTPWHGRRVMRKQAGLAWQTCYERVWNILRVRHPNTMQRMPPEQSR